MSQGNNGDLPKASLIVCSRNRPQMLHETVESILVGAEVPAELIVVDQSDTTNPTLSNLTPQRVPQFRYLWRPGRGLSRANNVGIDASTHDIIVFTHDDVWVTPAWFGAIVRALAGAPPRSLVTGQVLPAESERAGGFVPTVKVDPIPAIYSGRVGADVLYPLNMAMYRSAIDEVGKFDARLGPGTPFPAAEDNDFGFRLLEAGYCILYVPAAILYHRAWRSAYLSLRWSYGRGQGAYYAKYLGLSDRYMLSRFRWDIVRHIHQGLQRTRHQRKLACGDAIYVLGLLSGASQWLLTHRRMENRGWPWGSSSGRVEGRVERADQHVEEG